MERPCLSSHAHPSRLTERCLVDLRPLSCPFRSSLCSSPASLSCSYGVPRVFPPFPSALSRSVSSCVLPLFRARFRVHNVGGPLRLSPVNFYPPYSIMRSWVFRNTALVLFLLFVIELTCGLHVCVIYYQSVSVSVEEPVSSPSTSRPIARSPSISDVHKEKNKSIDGRHAYRQDSPSQAVS